jgi:hypothetical protein
MKNYFLTLLLSVFTFTFHTAFSQNIENEATPLFQNQEPLAIKLRYSIKDVKKNTNDSTYMASVLYYKNESIVWDSLKIDIRARGNNRRDNCYYVPLRLKLSKSVAIGTPF